MYTFLVIVVLIAVSYLARRFSTDTSQNPIPGSEYDKYLQNKKSLADWKDKQKSLCEEVAQMQEVRLIKENDQERKSLIEAKLLQRECRIDYQNRKNKCMTRREYVSLYTK